MMLGRMIGRKGEQREEQAVDEQRAPPARDRNPRRQRYTKADGDRTLSFRPSQVGVHSIAARRREHQVAAEWDETRSAWERQMATLRDSINDERQASASSQQTHGQAAAATVNAFLAETELLENVQVGRPAMHAHPSQPEPASVIASSSTGAPDISPLSARSPGPDRQHTSGDEADALMDAILLETG